MFRRVLRSFSRSLSHHIVGAWRVNLQDITARNIEQLFEKSSNIGGLASSRALPRSHVNKPKI